MHNIKLTDLQVDYLLDMIGKTLDDIDMGEMEHIKPLEELRDKLLLTRVPL